MSNRKFMTAIIHIPVEIYDDGSHKIYTDLYTIDFSNNITSSMWEHFNTPEPDTPEQVESPPSIEETIYHILSHEIKPRRNKTSQNTTFKLPAYSKKLSRFSRKSKEHPIQILDDPP